MGLRFRKSIKIAPGVKINFNKKSSSVTFGGKGVHYTMNSKGKKTASVGIPGTGLSYTKTSGGGSKTKKHTSNGGTQSMSQNNFQEPGSYKKWYQKTGWIIALLILFFPVGLFLMWKYTNWKKPVKGIITALILIIALSGIVSPDKLEQITLNADTEQTYDINQKISIEATTTPSDYELSDFKCSGGKITSNNQNISFIATKDGSYKIWAEHDGIKSNNLTLKVEDKAAIAKQKAKEEQERLAAEKAKKEAEEKAAQEAAEAQAKAEADAQAAAQAQAEAQQQAQAAAQAQQNNDPTVYITNTGGKYHRAGCRFLKQSQIEKHLSEVKGVYGPCGVCNPPQ